MHLCCVSEHTAEGEYVPSLESSDNEGFNQDDGTATSMLLELANASVLASSKVAPSSKATDSDGFNSLLAAIGNVQPPQASSGACCYTNTGKETSDNTDKQTKCTRIIVSNSSILEDILTIVKETIASGINGSIYQHPTRSDTNKYAPHFSISHEISLRVNMRFINFI
jgi:hypothetical protein